MTTTITYRELLPSEVGLLKTFAYEAIFVPEGVEPPPFEIVFRPEIAVYYEGFGSGNADFCIVAVDGDKVVGAVWTRIMNDYGHVDDNTPSFAISLFKEYRGKGIGTTLMMKMLQMLKDKGFAKASLAVQKANYAVKMYKKVGFEIVDENDEEYIMEWNCIMLEKEIAAYLSRSGNKSLDVKAFLFDMDGVLFDSMPFHARSWCSAMKEFGLSITEQQAYMNEGRTGASTINELALQQWGRQATQKEIDDIYKRKVELFVSCGDAEPMKGAVELLDNIRKEGLKIVLVTGSGQKSLLNRLNRFFPGIFAPENMVTAYDVKYGKPNPEPYLMGLKKAGVMASEAVVVENAPLGVRAGVAAGIFTIAVNTGPLPDEVLACEGANVIFPSMQYLADNWGEVWKGLRR